MFISADTLDDALRQAFTRLLSSKTRTSSGKGLAREIIGAILKIRNPRARFSRTENRAVLFSCLGETLWYLSGSNSLDHITYYIKKYRDLSGAKKGARLASGGYGPRIFGSGNKSQMNAVIQLIRRKLADPNGKSDTRQAVIQIYDKLDLLTNSSDVPCTCTMQFLPRGGRLHMVVHMRSNDAYIGLPHDVFAFTFMQEIVARDVGLELGTYTHSVGSLHLYDQDERRARDFLAEGWQYRTEMPAMPIGDPWPSIDWLRANEEAIRKGRLSPLEADGVDPYWVDLARLLRIFALINSKDRRGIVEEQKAMHSGAYASFIRRKAQALTAASDEPQKGLPGIMDGGSNKLVAAP
jgi:thymidylate synthase